MRTLYYIFVLFLSFVFSSPKLSGRRKDVYHASAHDVALVRIYNALECLTSFFPIVDTAGGTTICRQLYCIDHLRYV